MYEQTLLKKKSRITGDKDSGECPVIRIERGRFVPLVGEFSTSLCRDMDGLYL